MVDISTGIAPEAISAGVAEPALCSECGSQLEDAGCRVYCSDRGYKHNKE
ncbi:MAG: hypothetical protein PWR22_300 [Moorella sp. (in: firmicutes)]|jgi:hypothetical protein|nr:hypothetical protein [Moorella sp. (in: firmicutes)]